MGKSLEGRLTSTLWAVSAFARSADACVVLFIGLGLLLLVALGTVSVVAFWRLGRRSPSHRLLLTPKKVVSTRFTLVRRLAAQQNRRPHPNE